MENFLLFLPYIVLLVGVGLTFCFRNNVPVKLAAMIVFFCATAFAFLIYDLGKIIFVMSVIGVLLLNKSDVGAEIRSGNPFIWMMIALAVMFAVDMAMCWLDNKLWKLCVQIPVAVFYMALALRYAIKGCKNE